MEDAYREIQLLECQQLSGGAPAFQMFIFVPLHLLSTPYASTGLGKGTESYGFLTAYDSIRPSQLSLTYKQSLKKVFNSSGFSLLTIFFWQAKEDQFFF